ncbi:MAG: restriction endonuclease subunit S, partial [Prevotella sp.]
MKHYDEYKQTGTPWIGEIPSHWEVMKISHLFNLIGSGTTPNTGDSSYYSDETEHFWLQTGDLNDGYIHNTSKKITKKAIKELNLKVYRKGSLVIAMYGATVGKLGLLNIDTSVNQACCVISNSKRMKNLFLYYTLFSARKYLISLSVGGGQPNISQEIIKKHKIPVPPIVEQEAIAAYLDKKCGSIDAVIATQERRIALLEELKQSVITEAVTHGINPDAKLRPSGIDWIGNIPDHWQTMPLKYTANKKGCCFIDGDWIESKDIVEEGIKYITTGN